VKNGLLAGYIVFNVVVIAVALILERGRYTTKGTGDKDWEDTGEKFQDPTSGKWLEVRYNRKTGERDYVEIKNNR
jgi:hypothetical protein